MAVRPTLRMRFIQKLLDSKYSRGELSETEWLLPPHVRTNRFMSGEDAAPDPQVQYRFYNTGGYQMVAPHINGRRAFLIDTLALVRRLEAQGMTAKQAEAITAVITEVLNDSLESASQTFVSKAEMQRIEMVAETAMARLKSDLHTTQESRFSHLQREVEVLRTDVEKLRSELRYEIDKVTAGQRLDLNLERGRIKDELSTQGQETSNLTNKLDKEINNLKTQLEAAKYDVIKYCIGTVVSVAAVGIGFMRIMMS